MEIIAHRGASHTAPENTVVSAELAWAEGADALEFDVRLTADNRLAVIHDENTHRVAGTARSTTESTFSDLRTLEVGSWKHTRYRGEKIPMIEEMLATVPPTKRVFIELKSGPKSIPPLVHSLQLSSLSPKQVVTISFDFATVAAAKNALPLHEVAWILDRKPHANLSSLETVIDQCRKGGIDGLDLSAASRFDPATLGQIRQAGLKVYVWTVDEPALARRLVEAGVDGVTTNRPGWLRQQLAH